VNDAAVAAKFLAYWHELQKDQVIADLKPWDDANSPNPPEAGAHAVFSPQTGKSTLARYGEISDDATRALFMTFAFGMNKVFVPVYSQADAVLRFRADGQGRYREGRRRGQGDDRRNPPD
jgi:hypothetical protein